MEIAKESNTTTGTSAKEKHSWWSVLVSLPEKLKAKITAKESNTTTSTSASENYSWWSSLVSLPRKLKAKITALFKKLKKIGKDDPRRIFHSLKVGLALTLVSVFYYVTPLFNGLGVSACIWAVLTVVVVMEYTVGGTLGKGLNRTFATFLAGSLGLGAHHAAALVGERGEPVVLSLFVFLLAAAATFSRFIPEMKARYDYGVTIFILTFSLVTVSSYRVEELVRLAQQRLSTIATGVTICLFTTIFVFPVWAGEDLHMLVAGNLDKLASFLEGLGNEFREEKVESENLESKSFLRAHKSVLTSKPTEESLANFARWEPGHGKFSFRHQWRQYLKIGVLSRQCAYSIEALATNVTIPDKSQLAMDPEFGIKIRSACAEMSSESAKALSDLASSIRNMTSPAAAGLHVDNAVAAAGKLKTATPDSGAALSDVIRCAPTASLLAQVVESTQLITEAVEELARITRFRKYKPEPEPEHEHKPEPELEAGTADKAAVKQAADGESHPHVAIDIDRNMESINVVDSHHNIYNL